MIKRIGSIIRENQKYLLWGAVVFLLGIVLGYANEQKIEQSAQYFFGGIKKIGRDIDLHGGGILYETFVIFKNNAIVSCSMMGLGVFFFGLFPVIALLSNGIILGFLLAFGQLHGFSPVVMMAVGILPHGILELSAVIFAGAVGIKLGMLTYRGLIGLIVAEKRAVAYKEYVKLLDSLPTIVGVIIGMLFIAAIIETTITPYLLQNVAGHEIEKLRVAMKTLIK